MDIAIVVTLALFCAGVIYHSGRLAARVDGLEGWQKSVAHEIRDIREGIASLVERGSWSGIDRRKR